MRKGHDGAGRPPDGRHCSCWLICDAAILPQPPAGGTPNAQLAAGFGVGTTTAYRHIAEAVDILAALAPTLAEAVKKHGA